ncbi:hypothetical protein [Pseudomonas fluorescens]|uniref:hypothetical protein n=1 Tax=Pseudomonas fluorescens TaxID=294 RepID=UPI001249B5EE|nr:hypothetical protein [Pseudomonas fluorescens]CAG8864141.1 hypothetical protein PS861_00200 [Pseudomonas fluorescens]
MNKEQIYDDQISPLMQQIIGICKDKGIAVVASFDIAHDGEGPNGEDCSSLVCSTHLPDGEGNFNERFDKANQIIRRGHESHSSPVMHITTEHADGSKTLTAFI